MSKEQDEWSITNPPPGRAYKACSFIGAGRVALNLSTRLNDDDDVVTIVGVELSRKEALDLAATLVREASRR